MEVRSSSCADECCYEAFNLELCGVSTTHSHTHTRSCTQNAFTWRLWVYIELRSCKAKFVGWLPWRLTYLSV